MFSARISGDRHAEGETTPTIKALQFLLTLATESELVLVGIYNSLFYTYLIKHMNYEKTFWYYFSYFNLVSYNYLSR